MIPSLMELSSAIGFFGIVVGIIGMLASIAQWRRANARLSEERRMAKERLVIQDKILRDQLKAQEALLDRLARVQGQLNASSSAELDRFPVASSSREVTEKRRTERLRAVPTSLLESCANGQCVLVAGPGLGTLAGLPTRTQFFEQLVALTGPATDTTRSLGLVRLLREGELNVVAD